MIPFNKPYISGNEQKYLADTLTKRNIAGNGYYTKLCQEVFKKSLNNVLNLCTHSCTGALEMTAILSNINPGDEVIMPTYTFVTTASAFFLRGAKVVFVDSRKDHPGMNEDDVENLITNKTKAIVAVHYAGIACDMDKLIKIANKHQLLVIEDAAQSINSFYKNKPLGSIGDMGCFSFHETKNIQCGEGGMLSINNNFFKKRAEIIWEKGTNRSAFYRGEVDKYNWVDIGSSFLPSELNTSFLFAQLEELEHIQKKRIHIWNQYADVLSPLSKKGIGLPFIPEYSSNNAHMFYLICRNTKERKKLIDHLKQKKINAVFHYTCLHDSPFFRGKYDGKEMTNAKRNENCLVRLPLWTEMNENQVKLVASAVLDFFNKTVFK